MLTIQENNIKDFSEIFPICMIYIVSPNCPACESAKETLEALSRRHPEVPMRTISIFDAENLATSIGVSAVPYTVVFQNGEYIGGGASSNPEALDVLVSCLKQEEGML